ncbi:hypothetical protein [Rhizobium leguminosarum]
MPDLVGTEHADIESARSEAVETIVERRVVPSLSGAVKVIDQPGVSAPRTATMDKCQNRTERRALLAWGGSLRHKLSSADASFFVDMRSGSFPPEAGRCPTVRNRPFQICCCGPCLSKHSSF